MSLPSRKPDPELVASFIEAWADLALGLSQQAVEVSRQPGWAHAWDKAMELYARAAEWFSKALSAALGLTGGTLPAVAVATVNAGGDAGMPAEVTDPAGRVSRTYSDALGRTVRTIEDFTDGGL